MKKKKKLIIHSNYNPKPIFFIIFLLIVTLGVSPPVYTNSRHKEPKGKSNSYRSEPSTQSKPQHRSSLAPSGRPSRSSPPPRVENNNRSGRWGNSSPKQDRSSKLKVKTGKLIRHPRIPPPIIPEPPKKKPRKRKPHRKRHHHNSYWCDGGFISQTTGDDNEEYPESPNSGNYFTPGESNGLPGKEYHINDSFSLDSVLAKKIDEYNAKHLNQDSLEYPLTHWSASLIYQLLESLELIEHMEKKIQYYKQQLDAVRNSNLSPAEKSSKELFWLERIDRLEESRQKEEERVSDLRSQITEENKRKKRDR